MLQHMGFLPFFELFLGLMHIVELLIDDVMELLVVAKDHPASVEGVSHVQEVLDLGLDDVRGFGE
jgi:hypothetical protein